MAKKKTVKPTLKEARIIKARLERQYPQMFTTTMGAREQKAYSGLSLADQRALERMVGLKLKKIYKKKKR